MDNNTDKIIKEQFDSLPTDVKEAIGRVPWKDRVRDIAKREGLNAAQTDSLETETMLILYGFTKPEDYPSNLMSEVGVPDEQADRIAKLVTDEIVADIEKQFEMIDALMPKAAPTMPDPVTQKKPELAPEAAPEILAPEVPSQPETPAIASVPEIAPDILPETLPNEVAHDVPHIETPAPAPAPVEAPASMPPGVVGEKLTQMTSAAAEAPKPSYQNGVDPYREPIE